LEISDETTIPIRERVNGEYRFGADATYVVAGAFGGIGRQITRCMAHRGTQNLLLLSQSPTDQNTKARQMVSELKALEVCIRHSEFGMLLAISPIYFAGFFSSNSKVNATYQGLLPYYYGVKYKYCPFISKA
jgi:hypothetical protein